MSVLCVSREVENYIYNYVLYPLRYVDILEKWRRVELSCIILSKDVKM